MRLINIFNYIILFLNPLFQLEEVGHLDIDTSLNMCTFTFNKDDELKDTPIFLNHLYE
jgi:hypothetical protein